MIHQRKMLLRADIPLHAYVLQVTVQHIALSCSDLLPCPMAKGLFADFRFGRLLLINK